MSNNTDSPTIDQKTKHANFERYSVFIFGVVFLSVMIILSIWIPEPTKSQFFTLKLAMALAAAGIGALLPGLLELKIPLIPTSFIKASGAIGLFIIVWYTDPAKLAINGIAPPPVAEAPMVGDKFIALLDSKNYQQAYSMFSAVQRQTISEQTFTQLSNNVRVPLGNRTKGPTISNVTPANELMGHPGAFVGLQYQSRYDTQSNVWADFIILIAEEGDWKIQSHIIAPCTPPHCSPIPSL
jgi:hypothetical protein